MEGILMWKDIPVTAVQFSETGELIRYNPDLRDFEHAPLHQPGDKMFLAKWWKQRSVPVTQKRIAALLEERGLPGPEAWLLSNLGLSLTDCYWIRPAETAFRWRDVNLFENEFRENLIEGGFSGEETGTSSFTPNSSLQGELEKTWAIRKGRRVLIKGSRGRRSDESINEVLATLLHRKQGYANHTSYRLVRMKDRPYKYGCVCDIFTGAEKEFLPAWQIVDSEKKPGDVSVYEHFITVCGKHGIDTEQLRSDLEYQMLTDLVLSNRDRHLNNFGILRDTETLRFLRMAPVFDSGKSLFAGMELPMDDRELLSLETNSFAASEDRMRKYLKGYAALDGDRLLTAEEIDAHYRKDPDISALRREQVISGYERKLRLMRENGWI